MKDHGGFGDLFSTLAARRAKQHGMETVEAGADEAWTRAMEAAVVATARSMPRFTTDDVFAIFYRDNPNPPRTRDKRAMGPVMLRAAKAGTCCKANDVPWVPTQRRSRHAAPLQVWRSLIWRMEYRSDPR